MEWIEVKTLLTKVKHSHLWFGPDYNMNLYKGCTHGCIYCDSRSACYRIDHFDQVRGKKDAITILRKELASKRHKGVIGIGAMSDTYNPFEKQYELTRQALKLIHEFRFGVSLDTKSPLVTRDIDLFQQIQLHSPVIIKITITTYDDALSKKIEPHVAPSSKRFEAIRQLSDAGIFCGILMTPVLPFITDQEDNIRSMVKMAYEASAKFIFSYNLSVTLRENQRDYYYDKLDELFPGLKQKYIQRYGLRYECKCQSHQRLKQLFEHECQKYGLLYRMKDIIDAYQKNQQFSQLSLF